jgi:2-keto-4-pentenoate hydratase
VLGHPGTGIAWLANKLAADVALEPGQTVLSGSFIRIIEARPGDTFHADYGPWARSLVTSIDDGRISRRYPPCAAR